MINELAEEMEKNLKFITVVGLKEILRPGSIYLVKTL